MAQHLNNAVEWWEKWRLKNRLASQLLGAAIWLLATLPSLLALQWRWVVIVLSIVGFIVLIAFFLGDLAVARKKDMRFFWFPWVLAFLFYITLATEQIFWQVYKSKYESDRIAWDKERTQKDEQIRQLREKVGLSPEEEEQWEQVSIAFERGKYYRDIKTNMIECAKAFEEAYTNALCVALKHPEKCSWAGHLAGDLVVPYKALNRTNDASAALEVKVLLEGLMSGNVSLSGSSPCISPAIELRDRISDKPTR